ncbi:hypothetical protein AAV32_11195 [Kerstersia gyiorum]|uniref:Uncharacterized protein n=1 Tax=Kerstersia gyiorum TaxID=206506 RepID=A0A171KR96_9BURK|nr:hypothetical protein AAV32_11195 [Kerstersia gyiorum]
MRQSFAPSPGRTSALSSAATQPCRPSCRTPSDHHKEINLPCRPNAITTCNRHIRSWTGTENT